MYAAWCTSRQIVNSENAMITYGTTTNEIAAVVRLRTFGVRANAIFWPVIACPIDLTTPDRLTGSRIRLKP